MKRRASRLPLSALVKVGSAYRWPETPPIGAHVTLNSGGPTMLVVDTDALPCRTLTLAEPDGTEHRFPLVCLRPA